MSPSAVNLAAKFAQFGDLWSPKIIAQFNDYQLKLARVAGEFIWHSHPETDELFLVLDGELTIELRDGAVHLQPGELWVVPAGVEHRPVAPSECQILLIEPAGTANTGDAGGGTAGEWL
jgi:mannose-6-phosphate isomerase-like protein (cupin superfamily)